MQQSDLSNKQATNYISHPCFLGNIASGIWCKVNIYPQHHLICGDFPYRKREG